MEKIRDILILVVCGSFLVFILWVLWFGPLRECPFHSKDPNGVCITYIETTDSDSN